MSISGARVDFIELDFWCILWIKFTWRGRYDMKSRDKSKENSYGCEVSSKSVM